MKKIGFPLLGLSLLLALPLIHELTALGLGLTLSYLDEATWLRSLLENLPVSLTHSWLMVVTLSQIQPQGIAVAGAGGDFLHQLLPVLFLEKELVTGQALLSTIIEPESTPLARLVTRALTEVAMIYLGFIWVKFGTRFGSPTVLISKRQLGPLLLIGGGLVLVSQALSSIYHLPLSVASLEDMGLDFVIGPVVLGNPSGYELLLTKVVPTVFYGGLTVLGLLPWFLDWVFRNRRGKMYRPSRLGLVPFGLALLLLFSPLPPYLGTLPKGTEFGLAKSTSALPQKTEVVLNPSTQPVPILPTAMPALPTNKPQVVATSSNGPRVIKLQRSAAPGEFQLLVNGSPTVVRGVQYYFGSLLQQPPREKEAALRRDLAIIQQAGFTAVSGWEEEGFDAKFLKLTEEYGLSVIKPLSLTPSGKAPGWDALIQGDFLDPSFRAQVKEDLLKKVKADKEAPALLFWNIGADEPLEKMSRYHRRPPEQLQAAADLIVELALLAHEIDPAHPTIVSEPQDWYLDHYRMTLEKVRREGKDPSQFFVVGGNFYQPGSLKADLRRTKTAITEKLNVAFAVMEFAPFGVGRNERPSFRSKMAKEVAEITPISVVYVFNPAIDVLNNMPDPTLAIVTGLALTDLERTDTNGLLTALAQTQGRPFFPTALQILKADREKGFSGVPLSPPISQEKGWEQYFVGVGPEDKLTAYRWFWNENTDVLAGPQIVSQVIVFDGQKIVTLAGVFLQTYLEQGGLTRFGYPTGDPYEIFTEGKLNLRQDFSNGWSLVQLIVLPK